MITNPTGTLLFVEDLGGTAIYTYQIGQGGVLTAANNGSPLIVPGLPENLATDGLGKFLYVTLEPVGGGSAEIGAYAISSSGSLTVVPGSPFSYPMYQVQGEPSGKYLIGTASDSAISSPLCVQHSIDRGQRRCYRPGDWIAVLHRVSSVQRRGSTEYRRRSGLLFQSLHKARLSYNPIEGYQLNSSTGALTAISGSPFTSVSSGT